MVKDGYLLRAWVFWRLWLRRGSGLPIFGVFWLTIPAVLLAVFFLWFFPGSGTGRFRQGEGVDRVAGGWAW